MPCEELSSVNENLYVPVQGASAHLPWEFFGDVTSVYFAAHHFGRWEETYFLNAPLLSKSGFLLPDSNTFTPSSNIGEKTMLKHRIAAVLFVAFFILPLFTGCGGDGGDGGNAIKITGEKLAGEYDSNKIAADSKYKGKAVEITAHIVEIGTDSSGLYLLMGMKEIIMITLPPDIHSFKVPMCCYLKKSEESKVSKLSKGDECTIRGKCSGIDGIYVIIKNAVIVELKK